MKELVVAEAAAVVVPPSLPFITTLNRMGSGGPGGPAMQRPARGLYNPALLNVTQDGRRAAAPAT